MTDFCRWLNVERKNLMKDDVIAAYRLSFVAHYRLVSIHPWADGNGRMSRLVMNMLQWEFGLIPVKVFKEQKAEYIQALNDTRDKEDETIFPNVMLGLHDSNLRAEIKEFTKSQTSIIEGNSIVEPIAENIVESIAENLSTMRGRIVKILWMNPKATAASISKEVGIAPRNVQNHIKKLQEMGILRRKGGDFGGHWEIIVKDEK